MQGTQSQQQMVGFPRGAVVVHCRPPSAICHPPSFPRRAGFTLVELMVVIFIMLALMAIAVFSMHGFLEVERVKMAGKQAESAIRLARQYAMSRRNRCMVEFVEPTVKSPQAPTPGDKATFLKQDTTGKGSWQGVYGSAYYWLAQSDQIATPPSWATVTVTGQTGATWAATTTDLRALQRASIDERVAAGWTSGTNFTINVSVPQDNVYQVALYCLDYNSDNWAQKVEVKTAADVLLDTQTLSSFNGGVYLVWNVQGSVKFVVTNTAGSVTKKAAVSGLFIENASSEYATSTAGDSVPRQLRIIPYMRMYNETTGGTDWVLDQDASFLKILDLPANVHFALQPDKTSSEAAVDQYDPTNPPTFRTTVRKSFFRLDPDGTCTAVAPLHDASKPASDEENAYWAAKTNSIYLRDVTNNNMAMVHAPVNSSFTRLRCVIGTDEVNSLLRSYCPYTLW